MSIKTVKTTRITLDLPINLHKKVKIASSQTGKTMKDFFIKLIEQNFEITNKKTKKAMPKGLTIDLTNNQINQIITDVWLPKF